MSDGIIAATFRPINVNVKNGLELRGTFSNLAAHFSIDKVGTKLNSVGMHVSGDLESDVSLIGSGSIQFGYFSQAWREVARNSFNVLGVSGRISGLSSKDKIGQFPVAGLVFSLKCGLTSPCVIKPGQTQTPIRAVQPGGFIVWLYATLSGELSTAGELSFFKINSSEFELGFSKLNNQDFTLKNRLERNDESRSMVSVLDFKDSYKSNLRAGLTIDADMFVSGIRVANARGFLGTQAELELEREGSYDAQGLDSTWSWSGNPCVKGKLNAGLIASANVKLGLQINTAWSDVAGDFEYNYQIPKEEDLDKLGRTQTWFGLYSADNCKDTEPAAEIKEYTITTNWEIDRQFTLTPESGSIAQYEGNEYQISGFDQTLGNLVSTTYTISGECDVEVRTIRPTNIGRLDGNMSIYFNGPYIYNEGCLASMESGNTFSTFSKTFQSTRTFSASGGPMGKEIQLQVGSGFNSFLEGSDEGPNTTTVTGSARGILETVYRYRKN